MVNIKEGNFSLSKYNILISQSSVHTIWKFELIGKITLYLSGQVNTPRLLQSLFAASNRPIYGKQAVF